MLFNWFKSRLFPLICLLTLLICSKSLLAQDLEPRRWSQLPAGLNFVGVGVGHTEGDIFFDPLLLIEDANFDLEAIGLTCVRSFSLAGRSALVDFSVPYLAGRWEGTVNGEFINFRRRGPGDPRVRLSMLIYGGPAQTPAEFASFKDQRSNTVVGAAVAVTVPLGKYNENRLINLGVNQWVIRPQLGVTHTRGKWTGELTGSVFLYGDNYEFWRGTKLETDPLWALQGHLIYTFKPGLWASFSTGYGWDG